MANNYDDYELTDEGAEQNDPSKVNQYAGTNFLVLPEWMQTYKPEEGRKVQHQFRLITIPGTGSLTKLILAHFSVGGYNSVPCPTMFGEEGCPVCAKRQSLFKKFAKADRDVRSAALRPYKTTTYNLAIGINRKDESAGPQAWKISGVNTVKAINNLITNHLGQRTNIGHPTKGRDLFFKRYNEDGKKIDNKLVITVNDLKLDTEITPLSEDPKQIADWLDLLREYPVDSYINRMSIEEIAELMKKGGDIIDNNSAPPDDAPEDQEPQDFMEDNDDPIGSLGGEESEEAQPEKELVTASAPTPPVNREALLAKVATMKANQAKAKK